MKLHELRDNEGASKKRKRLGRGPGSGFGKTAGRGQKGQKSRSGYSASGFEGGQMPLYQRLPKRGFSREKRKVAVINLGRIQKAIDQKKLDPFKPIGVDELRSAGLIRQSAVLVKLLNKGSLYSRIIIHIWDASDAAKQHVVSMGGSVYTSVQINKNRLREQYHAAMHVSHEEHRQKVFSGKDMKLETLLDGGVDSGKVSLLASLSLDATEAIPEKLWHVAKHDLQVRVASNAVQFEEDTICIGEAKFSKKTQVATFEFTGVSVSAGPVFVFVYYKGQTFCFHQIENSGPSPSIAPKVRGPKLN
jgi:large subunit ribosomal protein L15